VSDSGGAGNAPPGWYPDGQGGQRWWDGLEWAAAEAPQPTLPLPTVPPPSGPPPSGPPPASPPGEPPYAAYPPPPPGATSAAATPGSGSPRNTKVLLAVVGGLVGVAVLAIVLVLALGGSDGPSSDDPAATVQAFFDAAEDGDCDAALELLTDAGRDLLDADDCESGVPVDDGDVSYDIGDAEVDGDAATVAVTVRDASADLGLDEVTLDFALLRTDDVWLIDGFGIGGLPEDLPDDLTSELPSELDPGELPELPEDFEDFDPEDFLSDLPSDFDPEDFLSDFPTDFDPEDLLSDFPTDLFTDLPTE
jgi:hypothetical protein